MNLLFFDIECASVFKYTAKICVFGYVLCDEQFNIIKKEDILINPKGKFHLTNRKGSDGLVLPYNYDEFVNYPLFKEVYPQIRGMLEDDNNLCIGHSTLNDIKYLDLETKRYKLPSLNFYYADTQLMYMTLTKSYDRQMGLEAIAEELKVEFTPHRAVDDAYATMRICQEMCRQKGLSIKEMESKFGLHCGKIENHNITLPRSDGQLEYFDKTRQLKIVRTKKRQKLFNYINRKKVKNKGILVGKIYNFYSEIEEDLPLAKELISKIYDRGGQYVHKITKCNVYVYLENDNSTRRRIAEQNNDIQVISLEELESTLND